MNYSNCFPSDWIGKKLVRVNDSCYFVNGDSTKQVAVPFGHKGVSARWLPNGVLRIDTDSNVSYFFVGSQRFFEAYGDETEPHDIQSYRKAVEECRRFRAEKKGQKMAATNEQKSNNHITDNKGGKNNKSRLGLGALVGGAIASIKELHNIDKPSDELIATSQSILDSMYQEQEQMAERWRRDEEKSNKAWERRNKEIDELRKADQVNSAREKKSIIFDNLSWMLSTESVLLSKDPVYHYLGINDSQRKTAVLCAIEGYRKSYNEVFGELRSDEKRSKKYFQCWSEIFYLIEEGLLFQDKHIEEVSKIINDTCGLNNTEESEDLINFDEYLKRCYSKLEDAYWGYNFEKDPKENQIKERLRYLEDNIFLDEDFEDLDDDKGGSEFIFNDIEDDEDEYEDDNEEDEEDEEDEEENDDEEEKDTKQIVAASPAITPKQTSKSKITVNDEKYDDLIISGFKKVSSDEELLKPKNAFDLITKGKNKQITYYKNKWNDSMWKRDHELKKKIKHEIVRIEEQTITLLSYNEKLNTLIQSGKSTGFWGFGGSKEVNDVKSRMKTIKERISEYKDKLMEALDDLDSCEEKIQEYSDELYELTNLKKYTEFKRLEGKGMSVARQLAKCKIDPSNLKTIFEL